MSARRGIAGRADDRALARCEELEERAVATRELATARGEVPQRVAAGRLHLHHVCTRVAEQLRRVAAGDPGRQIDHADVAQAVHDESPSRGPPF
jgi:hypothetical protein